MKFIDVLEFYNDGKQIFRAISIGTRFLKTSSNKTQPVLSLTDIEADDWGYVVTMDIIGPSHPDHPDNKKPKFKVVSNNGED